MTDKKPKTLYSIQGDRIFLIPASMDGTVGRLPPANYVVDAHPMTKELMLRKVDSFSLPAKIYGRLPTQADRIMATFDKRAASTGVLLVGDKGSGKTLLAKSLAIKAAEAQIPTIVINAPFQGDAFNTFIQAIEQPAVILFDEFEKVYSTQDDLGGQEFDPQQGILTLLDGVFPTKKLFVLTCNNQWKVDRNLINRPGRIYYYIEFGSVSDEFIAEYCEDTLNDKSHIESLQNLSRTLGSLNFDQLQAIVEEMNRWEETPAQAIQILNVKTVGLDRTRSFQVISVMKGKNKYFIQDDYNSINGDPFSQSFLIYWFTDKAMKKRDSLKVTPTDLSFADNERFTYQKNKVTIVIQEEKEQHFNLNQFAFGYGN